MHFSFKIFFFTPSHRSEKLKYIVYDDQGRVYLNCKFHDPGAGSDVRAWPYMSYSEYILSSTLSIYSTLIAIVLRDFNAAFLYNG